MTTMTVTTPPLNSPTELLIGDGWTAAASGATLPVENPATGETLTEVADAGREDALAALDAAAEASASWAASAPRERGEILRRAFELVTERADEAARLITLEMGKPLAEAHAEVKYGAEFLRWFSEEAARIYGRYNPAPGGDGRILVMKEPVGPCLLITPWNFPIAMGTRKVGPAVAAGCTMILKPAKQTPLTSLWFAEIMLEAGLPAGVLNVITSSSASSVVEPLMRDQRLRKMSFTGSTEVGRLLVEQSATRLLRTSLELGGNAPFLVFDDADLDAAVEGALLAKMRSGGEACTAANRFYVHRSICDEFGARLAERMGNMIIGPGMVEGVEVGPVIDSAARANIAELVKDAVRAGAEVLTGGEALDRPGYFYRPTLLRCEDQRPRILNEEIFGPAAPVLPFDDEEEAIAAANDTEYGLVAYVYSKDLARALRVGEQLQTGMLGINRGIVSNPAAPFGGVKASGLGREGGLEGISEYLETKYAAFEL